MKPRPTLAPGALVRWLQGVAGANIGVVIALPDRRSVRVRFDSGDEAMFAPSTSVLGREEFPTGHVVRVLADGTVANVVGVSIGGDGLLTYRLEGQDKSVRLVQEADIRSDEAVRQREAVQEERARKQAEVAAQAEAARLTKEAALTTARVAAEAEKRKRDELRRTFLAKVVNCLENDFLNADRLFEAAAGTGVTRDEFEGLKSTFVQDWAARELGEPLDREQASAVAALGGDIKVVARAGSGKTRTLTTRAIFLLKHCGVSPREILLLAFNRKAAREMRERMASALGDALPHVMTFHALAHAVVRPAEEILFDDRQAAQLGLSREVQEVIDEHIRSSEHRDRIRELMLAHFRDDWEAITDRGIHLSIADFMEYRRSLPRETLRGDYVKSFGEREIANALFEHDVRHFYERNERWDGQNYRPDFTVPTPGGGIVIEYFGLEGDPDYDEMSEEKRRYWDRRDGWTLLEYTPRDLVSGGASAFRQRLISDLERLGVATRRRDEEEIWQAVRVRAVDNFSKTMTTFISRCRKRNLTSDELGQLCERHNAVTRPEEVFLEIGRSVYAAYIDRLSKLGKDDFDGILWRATKLVQEGESRFARDHGREQGDLAALRFVLVDEFQDFSGMFAALLAAIRACGSGVEFFCVGDDWQAINGFAGADLAYFTDFAEYFDQARVRTLTTNFRSAEAIVSLGNAVMFGRGDPAVPRPEAPAGKAWLCSLDAFSPSAFEREEHERDEITPAVLRIIRHLLDEYPSVVLLCRRNRVRGYVHYKRQREGTVDSLERFLAHVRSFLLPEDRERVTISTTHQYKGLESPAVVVLDAFVGSYPLVHPAWIFLRVFGDSLKSLEAEERRLFYVALTRARDAVAVITEKQRVSPFLADVQQRFRLAPLSWASLPAVAAQNDARLEVRAHGSMQARDQLKELGFRYESSGRYWYRTYQATGFSLDSLLDQSWARLCSELSVHDTTGKQLEAVWPNRGDSPSR